MTDWTIKRLEKLCDVDPGPSGTYQGDVADTGDGLPMIMQIGPDNTVEPRGVRAIPARYGGDLAFPACRRRHPLRPSRLARPVHAHRQ